MRFARVITLMLFTILFIAACSKEPRKPALEGVEAPGFTLQGIDGKGVALSDLKGKVVMLNFWATWCPPCREEIPSMVRLNKAMSGKPFQMLAVSIDEGGKDAVARFFASNGATLPVLLDNNSKVGKLYGITGVPETFIIDRKGVIVKKVIGPLDWSDPTVIQYLDDVIKR
jgi:peroxiredoxin